jgi:Zn-finger nucleic acid-binding protein
MRDPHAERVWLDRCPNCRAVWFDAGEPEATAGRDVPLSITAVEVQAICPACGVPLREATLAHAPAYACERCRGVHLKPKNLDAVSFDTPDEEPTLRPPALFECVMCKRTFSLDQGDGVTCRACAPSPSVGGANAEPESSLVGIRVGITNLVDALLH